MHRSCVHKGLPNEGIVSKRVGGIYWSDPAYANALDNAALLHMQSQKFAVAFQLLEQIRSTSLAEAAEIRRLAHLCRLEAKTAETRG